MSAVAAIVSSGPPVPDGAVAALLALMHQRGADHLDSWLGGAAALGVARFAWECSREIAGAAEVVRDGSIALVADASLYYTADLRRRLRSAGIEAAGESAGALIVAAHRAWGAHAAERLEGDFAYVLWDADQRRLFAACDYTGGRSLFFREHGTGIAVASTVGALVGFRGSTESLNLVTVAETAAGLFASSEATALSGISRLGAGHRLEWTAGAAAQVARFWHAPRFADAARNVPSFDDAARELQALLIDAVGERMAGAGPTAISMSGGWDSSSVFGAGQEAIRRSGETPRSLVPVSVSFPEGDSGREDETIRRIATPWNARVRWIDSRSIPMFDRVLEHARARDEPFAHPYETFNRALARGGAASGARIELNGFAGDPLFQVSPIFLADLFRRGRWRSMMREWRAFGGAGWRNLFRWSVQPLLPPIMLHAAKVLRGGRPLRGHLEKTLPPWMRADFVRKHALLERERQATPTRTGESEAAYEARWSLEHGFFPRIYGSVVDLALDEGVAARAPLFDSRVLQFAASRPRWERASGGETKRLLRAAMRGVLPDEVIAARPARTGTLAGYFVHAVRDAYPTVIAPAFEQPILEQLGIVDGAVLRREAARVASDLAGPGPGWLMFTFLTEVWLRERFDLMKKHSPRPSA